MTHKRCGNYYEVGIAHLRHSTGMEHTARHNFLKQCLHAGLYDVQMTLIGHFHHMRVYVNSNYLNAMFGSYYCRGQTDVA